CRSVEVAGGEAGGFDLAPLRLLLSASRQGSRAARVETAARRWLDRVRDFAVEDDALAASRGMERKRGGEERFRVGMERLAVHGVARAGLDELARVHHRQARRQVARGRQ